MAFNSSILLQHIAPKQLLTQFSDLVANCRTPWIAHPIIRSFVRRYEVNMDEAVRTQPEQYVSFNDFFTRALKPGVRPLDAAEWVCPVDGKVSQFGAIRSGQLIQAKGREFSAAALLGDAEMAQQFQDGHFATLYLSPRDYHRIHMPCDGRLLGMRHIPGELFSVNPTIVAGVDSLFARNERLVCWFEHPVHGVFVMVLVGAVVVGSIATVWHGIVTPPRKKQPRQWLYPDAATAPVLRKGEEMGHFQLGSTVVMLLPSGDWRFNPAWREDGGIRLGENMAA